ncbi:hypothetical protein BG24_3685 [Burkholderia pseudomallei PB08298010]|nr:hypothetical protein BG24_3685 [Burkholderia pseudomallei PB08298010]
MQQSIQHITVEARGRGLVEFTPQVRAFVEVQSVSTGLLTVFCRHTSASLLIQENADPSVQRDIERYFAALAPEDDARYEHDTEGADDMPRRTCARRSRRCSYRFRSSMGAWCSARGKASICSNIGAPRIGAMWCCI